MGSVLMALVLMLLVSMVLVACDGASRSDTAASSAPSVDTVAEEASAATRLAPPPPPPVWRSCLLDGVSPCVSSVPIRVKDEWIAWSDWLGAHAREAKSTFPQGITECRWVAELDAVLLCASSDTKTMNPPLMRAAMFTESRPGVVVPRRDPLYTYLLGVVGGFDFPKTHPNPARPGLLDFYEAVDRACPQSKRSCLDPDEQAMRDLVERAWIDKPSFVLITFANGGAVGDMEALSHELAHAQYFTDERYRRAIEIYWNILSPGRQAQIRYGLGSSYNRKDDDLMQNEFQAYALEAHGEKSEPDPRFNVWDALALRGLLAYFGVEVLEVERR